MALAYPYPGCLVEFLEDNAVRIAMVLEDSGGKLRLLLPGRRETKLAANRVLPWIGPACSPSTGKEEAVKILEQHQQAREAKSREIPLLELWEMAQGEISQAPAEWFAELMESAPDTDTVSAYGRALLGCRTHFRFQPPEFAVYDATTVDKRLAEHQARAEKEAIASHGAAFLRLLWEVASRKRALPAEGDPLFPEKPLADRIRRLLLARMASPDSDDDESLWRMLSKGLPDVPHLPLQLLMAWGVLPAHYNFWLDRADYKAGDAWWKEESAAVQELISCGRSLQELQACEIPFISIDGAKTIDIDDAFYIARTSGGWEITIALAMPAFAWDFGSALDRLVIHRATSIYLPEGDMHMLPEILGTNIYSLRAEEDRPAFCLRIRVDESGRLLETEPFAARVRLAANLHFDDVQAIISGEAASDNPAAPWSEQLLPGHELAGLRETLRVEQGAVIMLREEPELKLEQDDDEVKVILEPEKPARDAQRLVSEMMILAGSALAEWAFAADIPLLHRTQSVTVPREYAGIWKNPEDLARIMRSLVPSSLEIAPRPHAALGLTRYAQVTSPLRRYPDLVNEAQVLNYLNTGKPKWNEEELEEMLNILSPVLEDAGHIQRYRPRYWKLLYFRQQGDKAWYHGVITEENDNFVSVVLPHENIQLRGRRNIFDERARPGASVRLRVGKVSPLMNDIQILEALPED